MRIFVLLLFIINFFVFSCSPSNSLIINRTNYFSEDEPDDYISKIINCFRGYDNSSNTSSRILGKCLINATRNNVEDLYNILITKEAYSAIEFMLKNYDPSGKIQKYLEVLHESASTEEKVLINYIYLSLNHSDSYGLHLLDYMYSIIEEVEKGDLNHKNILNNISYLFQEFEINNIYDYLKENHTELLPELVEMFLSSTQNFEEIYRLITEDFLKDYKNQTIILIIDILSTFNDSDKTLKKLGEFFKHNNGALPGLKRLMLYEKFSNILKELFSYYNQNNFLDAIT